MVVCLRHAQTDFNITKGGEAELFRGNLDIPINAQGQREAVEAAGKIGLPVKFIVSDSHPRDYQTAEILAQLLRAPIVIDERMRPIDIGLLSGKSTKEMAEIVDWFFHNPDFPFPGGEAVSSWYTRQKAALTDYIAKDGGDPYTAIVVICQGSTFRALPAMESGDDWALIEPTTERVPTGALEWLT